MKPEQVKVGDTLKTISKSPMVARYRNRLFEVSLLEKCSGSKSGKKAHGAFKDTGEYASFMLDDTRFDFDYIHPAPKPVTPKKKQSG